MKTAMIIDIDLKLTMEEVVVALKILKKEFVLVEWWGDNSFKPVVFVLITAR